MEKSNSSRGLLGFLLGGAVGLAVGLLIAPEQGEKLRRKVAYRVKHLARDVEDLVDRLGQQQLDSSEAHRRGAEIVEETTLQAKQLQDEMETLMNNARQQKKASPPEALN